MRQLDVVVSLLKDGKVVRILARGNSMRPYLVHERDYIILQQTDHVKVGDSVLAEVSPSHYVLHRIVDINGQKVTLRGDGNYATEHCELKDVCGKAIAFERKGSNTQEGSDSLHYKIYSWFWMHTLPLRRYFLYAHHLLFSSRKELYKTQKNMKKKVGFEMRSVCGETFLVAEGIENIDFNQLIALNETAAFLWESMGESTFTIDNLVEKLTAEYEVSAEEAKANIEQFLLDMKNAGVVED